VVVEPGGAAQRPPAGDDEDDDEGERVDEHDGRARTGPRGDRTGTCPTAPGRGAEHVEIHSMRLNESLDMRATTAGMTSVAATRVTPMICRVARIDSDSTTMSSARSCAGGRPDTAGHLGVEAGEQERAVADGEDDGRDSSAPASSSRSSPPRR
jgi:hypothetical protein